MNSRGLGADFAFAWPRATIGVMGAQQAVGIINRREIAAAASPQQARAELADVYALEHQGARSAARDGVVDELVAPSETRERLVSALRALRARRGALGTKGNIPL